MTAHFLRSMPFSAEEGVTENFTYFKLQFFSSFWGLHNLTVSLKENNLQSEGKIEQFFPQSPLAHLLVDGSVYRSLGIKL